MTQQIRELTKSTKELERRNHDLNYKADISIDRLKLDDILEDNPTKYAEWGEQWATAKKSLRVLQTKLKLEKDKYKENLEYTKAKLSEDLRINFDQYGFEKKPTDKQSENWFIVHAEYQAAIKSNKKLKKLMYQVVRAESICDRLEMVIEAFKQKGYDLGSLVQLHHDLYWNVPTAKEKKRQLKDESHYEEQNSKINEKMKRRKDIYGD